jgi:hypothetical protein
MFRMLIVLSGTALYATLVSDADTNCAGVLTIDGQAHDFDLPKNAGPNGDSQGCTTVGTAGLTDTQHVGVLSLHGQQDRTRCRFLFAGLLCVLSLARSHDREDHSHSYSSSVTTDEPESLVGTSTTPVPDATTGTGTSATSTPTDQPDAAPRLVPGILVPLFTFTAVFLA